MGPSRESPGRQQATARLAATHTLTQEESTLGVQPSAAALLALPEVPRPTAQEESVGVVQPRDALGAQDEAALRDGLHVQPAANCYLLSTVLVFP